MKFINANLAIISHTVLVISNSSNHIVLRELTPDELVQLKIDQGASIFFYDQELSEKYPELANKTVLEIDAALKSRVNYEVMASLSNIPALLKANSTELKALTTDISIWYYHRFRAYFDVRNSLYFCEAIKALDSDNRGVTHVYANDAILEQYFSSIAEIRIIRGAKKSNKRTNYRAIFLFLFNTGIYFLLGFRKSKRIRAKRHLFLTVPKQYITNNGGTSNVYFGKILSENRDDVGIIEFFMFPKLKGSGNPPPRLNTLFKKREQPKLASNFTLLPGFLRSSIRKRVKSYARHLKSAYAEIDSWESSTEKYLLMQLKVNHASSTLYYFQYQCFSRFFSRSSIKSICAMDENSPNTKCILDAAKANGIRTIGIQHGSIHPLHPAYMYTEDDLNFVSLVDDMMVWGRQTFDLLSEKSVFSKDRVHIIGQPRTDFLVDSIRSIHPSILPETLTGKQRVLFLSQPQRDESIRKQAAIDVIESVASLPHPHLIIKVHPSEEVTYYEAIAKSLGFENRVTVFKNEIDLYVLLTTSDVVITCFSTVGAEAALLRRPLIVLDYLKQDIQEYVKQEIAIMASNRDELQALIDDLLNADQAILKEKFKHDAFISNYAHKVDGKVAERFWEFMESAQNNEKTDYFY